MENSYYCFSGNGSDLIKEKLNERSWCEVLA